MKKRSVISFLVCTGLYVGIACHGLSRTSLAEDLLRDTDGNPSLDKWNCYSGEPIENTTDVWQLKDGVLTCQGLPRGYLSTKQSYQNFVLTLQWRWPPNKEPGKGGVLFRKTGEDKVWPKCCEAQINIGDEGDIVGIDGYKFSGPSDRFQQLDHESFGTLRFLKKADAAARPAGQWNDYQITVRGDRVKLVLNGREVNQATDCDITDGPILLTAENDAIQFRKVELQPLD